MILQYCGDRSVQWGDDIAIVGITSVLWRVFSTLGDNISTCGGNISTVVVNISIVKGIQYNRGYLQYSGGSFSTVGDNISNVEVALYSGDEDLKHYEFSKIIEIFSTAYFTLKSDRPHYSPQLLTTADMVKDLGYKILVLGKILL